MTDTTRHPAANFGPLALIGDEAASDLDGQIAAVHLLGWHTLELRSVSGRPLAELSRAEVRNTATRLADANLRVVSLASRIGNWARPVTSDFTADLTELDTLLEQSHVLGSRMIRIMSYPNDGLPEEEWGRRVTARVQRLTARAEAAGVTLVHENCAGWAGDNAARTLRLLREVASPALQVLFDTGNGVPHGYESEELLKVLLPHVAHVHIKDAVRTPDGCTTYTLPGSGAVDLTACLELLAHGGYAGALSLEPHLAVLPHNGLNLPTADATHLMVRAGKQLERLLHGTQPPCSPQGATGSSTTPLPDTPLPRRAGPLP